MNPETTAKPAESWSASELAELIRWQPQAGVLSIYLEVDPADRGEGWRIELRNGLAEAIEQAEEAPLRRALQVTAERMAGRLGEEGYRGEGRARVGFVEVAPKPGHEIWRILHLAPRRTEIRHAERPYLRPLLEILDDGAPRGVAVLSAERIRLLQWSLGLIEELEDWGIELFSLDWRERKAQRVSDPARAQWTAASGRDQFAQRLDANRERFLRHVGELVGGRAGRRPWRELLAIGGAEVCRHFADGLGEAVELHRVEGDLIAERPGQIKARVEEALEVLNRSRELALVERALAAAHAEAANGALGPQETLEALAQGRVAHLLIDTARDYEGAPLELGLAYEASDEQLPLAERMIELALNTSAAVTPVEGAAAERLGEHGGVAALLRY
jgi:hypothetical protein